MIPDNVTLIVKAPNQQIDDQNVECLSSWTIGQLKNHLSEVYPNKPKKDEQKIIYSGQLLEDSTILKDILRMYESQVAYTIHLVCSPKRMDKREDSSDGLRQRTSDSVRPETATRPETRQNDENTPVMQNYLSGFGNYARPQYPGGMGGYVPLQDDPVSLANHMAMVQQAYMQYYQHYANYMQMQAPAQPPAEAPAAPAQPQAAAPPPEDEPIDWLDHIYAATRLALLTSLVYFYGSPVRFLLVVLVAVAIYLHQIGYFRDRQANNREQAANAAQPAERQADPRSDADNVGADDRQSILAVTWTIFASFFASLVPETN